MKLIITGTSRGIGKALLALALKQGHEVLSISRSKTTLSTDTSSNWVEILGDLTDEDLYNKVKDELEKWKSLDCMINNAGFLVSKPFEELSYKDVKRSFDVNFYGPLRLTQLCLPYLKESRNASHINIGSIGGVQGSLKFPGLSVYSSSKGALAMLTECLAEEYKDSAIHFNCLALGAVQTEMLEQAFPGYNAPYTPDQMAYYILSFIESSSPMMNGKIITVSASTP